MEDVILLTWQYYPKQSIVSTISVDTPMTVFVEMEKRILKFKWNRKGPLRAKNKLKKKKLKDTHFQILKLTSELQ